MSPEKVYLSVTLLGNKSQRKPYREKLPIGEVDGRFLFEIKGSRVRMIAFPHAMYACYDLKCVYMKCMHGMIYWQIFFVYLLFEVANSELNVTLMQAMQNALWMHEMSSEAGLGDDHDRWTRLNANWL
jgi:hypothetical protein